MINSLCIWATQITFTIIIIIRQMMMGKVISEVE